MTFLLLSLAGIGAALGTRACAVPLIAAAVLGAMGNTVPAVAAWAAATAVGLLLLGATPRRLAVPVLGVTAALASASPRNAGVVLALWVVATGAAVLTRPDGPEGRRWALTVCLADLPFYAAVAWTALAVGFEGWPGQLPTGGVALLLFSAALRAPLASGPSDEAPESGLLTVRTQAIVSVVLALGAQNVDPGLVVTAVLAGAVAFAFGGVARRAATRDVVQEVGLLAVVVGAARLGWGPTGWEWGVLAAGTLIHYLRLRVGADSLGRLAGALVAGGGIGLPLLPVVVAALEGSTAAPGWRGTIVMAGLVAGLAARTLGHSVAEARRASRTEVVARGIAVGACVAAGLWAPLLTLQRSSLVEQISWPPLWASLVLVAAAIAGGGRGDLVPDRLPDRPPEPESRWWRLREVRVAERVASDGVLVGTVVLLATLAVGMWAFGVVRGFL